MCLGFHARIVSVRSKLGCTVIICDCHVALFVLKNRLFRCDRLRSIDQLRSDLLIWSIKFRLNDLID